MWIIGPPCSWSSSAHQHQPVAAGRSDLDLQRRENLQPCPEAGIKAVADVSPLVPEREHDGPSFDGEALTWPELANHRRIEHATTAATRRAGLPHEQAERGPVE